jgi:hypothetical protein
MFRATNFTESNESYRNIDGEMEIAARLWTHFESLGCKTREEREFAAYKFACDIYESKHGAGTMPASVSQLPEEKLAVWMVDAIASDWYAEWAEHAFPRIQTSHSFATMLMSTTVSAKELENFEAPWPAFAVEIPDGLLPIKSKDVDSCITRVMVNTHFMPHSGITERWWTMWMQGKRIELCRAGTLAEMVSGKMPTREMTLVEHDGPRSDVRDAPIEDYDAFFEDYDDAWEERVALLVSRLVVGACVMMTDRANYREKTQKLSHKIGAHALRMAGRPDPRIYRVGQPVSLDLREEVRRFIEGRKRGPLTVQRLVAGHHKRQPHGPNSSLRKWIFVQPYWQGDAQAPIVVRPHVAAEE